MIVYMLYKTITTNISSDKKMNSLVKSFEALLPLPQSPNRSFGPLIIYLCMCTM